MSCKPVQKRRVYIAGPMTGIDEFNFPAFQMAAQVWRGWGWDVENPAENFDGDTTREYAEYMRAAVGQVLSVDTIALLPGWQDSRGAQMEVAMGRNLGLDFFSALTGTEITNDIRGDAVPTPGLRSFDGGAVRDSEAGKYDFEGFLSPLVIEAFARYMDHHRRLPDGSVRGSDNWQSGIPRDVYMKSAWRHFMDVWTLHRGYTVVRPENGDVPSMEDALCGLLFNVQGYLHELLRTEVAGALHCAA